MHRSSKRIVTPLFLLLVAAAVFVPEVRGDGIPMVNFTVNAGDTWFFTLPQNPVPDLVGVEDFGLGPATFQLPPDSFGFVLVPVFASFMPPNTPLTYDVFFSRTPDLPDFLMFCDPFTFSQTEPPFFHCDFIPRIDQTATPIWTGSGNDPTFIPGVYGALTISEAPEPSTLALLLMSFATLSLISVLAIGAPRAYSRRNNPLHNPPQAHSP